MIAEVASAMTDTTEIMTVSTDTIGEADTEVEIVEVIMIAIETTTGTAIITVTTIDVIVVNSFEPPQDNFRKEHQWLPIYLRE